MIRSLIGSPGRRGRRWIAVLACALGVVTLGVIPSHVSAACYWAVLERCTTEATRACQRKADWSGCEWGFSIMVNETLVKKCKVMDESGDGYCGCRDLGRKECMSITNCYWDQSEGTFGACLEDLDSTFVIYATERDVDTSSGTCHS